MGVKKKLLIHLATPKLKKSLATMHMKYLVPAGENPLRSFASVCEEIFLHKYLLIFSLIRFHNEASALCLWYSANPST